MHTPHVKSGGRYPVLRTIAILYIVGGIAAALGSVVGAVWSLFGSGNAWMPMGTSPDMADRIVSCIVMLAGGFIACLSMFAIAEVLKLFIDIERNTRLAAPVAAEQSIESTPMTSGDGGYRTRNRLGVLDDEETAEAALLRGH